MTGLFEVFAIEEALRKFEYSDLCSASLGLFQAMGYPIKWREEAISETIENFLYFSVQNKVHFNNQEMEYLKQIDTASFLCHLEQCDILNNSYGDDTIVILAVDLNSSYRDRSEDAYYITKILNKTYNGFVVILFKLADFIVLCTCVDDGNTVCMSKWFNINQADIEELFELIPACYPFITGAGTIKDLYEELSFGISREYIKYPESYEYIAYQCIPNIEIDINIGDTFITKQQINDFAEQSKNYYRDIYDYDFVVIDNTFAVMEEEDDEWTLLELDNFVLPDAEIEQDEEFDEDDIEDQFDYSDIDEETLNDPVKLLKWLDDRKDTNDGD